MLSSAASDQGLYCLSKSHLSLVMRKPVFVLCEQQRHRSACTSTQSDQHLCCSLLRQYNTCSCYVLNFQTLAKFCSWAGWFEYDLVANREDRFSHDGAHLWDISTHGLTADYAFGCQNTLLQNILKNRSTEQWKYLNRAYLFPQSFSKAC